MISPSVCMCECPLLKLGSYTSTDSRRWGVIFLNESLPGISAGRICLLSRRLASTPGSGRSPGEGNGYPLTVFLPLESRGQRSLVSYSPWGLKELDAAERLSMHARRLS